MTLDRLIILGLDGATYDVLLPLAQAGVMPNMQMLLRDAALAELRSTLPAITPTAWSTLLTGCDPQEHGVFDYRTLDPHSGALRLQHAGDLRRTTLIEHVLAAGADVVSINVPMTAAMGSTRGLVIGGIDLPSAETALAAYPAFCDELARRGIDLSLDTIWHHRPESYEELTALVAATERDFSSRAAAAQVADGLHRDWRLMLVQFQTLDALQHRAWHLLEGVGGQAPSAWTATLMRAFAALDRAVGDLIELAQRRGAGVMVLSDHGFGRFREKISMPELFRRRGLLQPQSWLQGGSYRLQRTLLKTRKWAMRHLSSVRSAAGVERNLAGLLPCDWRRTVAFTAHGNLAALVYLHGTRRFGTGPLTTERDQDQAAADVLAILREARHPDTDEPLFADIYRTAERFAGDPLEHGWPDVVAIPADGFHTRHKFDRGYKLMRHDPTLTGTHRQTGVLMVYVPGAVTGQTHQAEARDVAPTVLGLLGLPSGEPMSGDVLSAMCPGLKPCVLPQGEPVPCIPDTRPATADAEEAAVLARLQKLGYLD